MMGYDTYEQVKIINDADSNKKGQSKYLEMISKKQALANNGL